MWTESGPALPSPSHALKAPTNLLPIHCSGGPTSHISPHFSALGKLVKIKNVWKVSYFSFKSLENFILYSIIFLVCYQPLNLSVRLPDTSSLKILKSSPLDLPASPKLRSGAFKNATGMEGLWARL